MTDERQRPGEAQPAGTVQNVLNESKDCTSPRNYRDRVIQLESLLAQIGLIHSLTPKLNDLVDYVTKTSIATTEPGQFGSACCLPLEEEMRQRRERAQPPEFPPSWEREIPIVNEERQGQVTARKGNWMQTIGGRAFYPLDPRPEEIDIQDIAHALAHVCRFGGHCKAFYSVAEHCVRVSQAIREAGGTVAEQFEGLMHDSAEAYVGDMVWPLKQVEDVSGYKRVEKLVEAAIAERFQLPHEQSPIVKKFDLVLLSTEKRDLMMDGVGREDGSKRESAAAKAKLGAWHCDEFKALPDRIDAWMPTKARLRFLDLFFDLRGVR